VVVEATSVIFERDGIPSLGLMTALTSDLLRAGEHPGLRRDGLDVRARRGGHHDRAQERRRCEHFLVWDGADSASRCASPAVPGDLSTAPHRRLEVLAR
jgi:hypothetical protein